MVKAARSSSTIRVCALAALLALGACARPAPELPLAQDMPAPQASDAPDRLQRCDALVKDITATRAEMATIEDVIAGKRHEDQVQGYLFAVLFPVGMIAMDQHSAQKKALDERQAKVDADLAQERQLRCPTPA